jgi:SAM-dependent methyltransferase
MRESIAKLQSFIDDWRRDRDSIKVLEAGCGSLTHIDFKHRAYIVGIDISQKQLERNFYLHEKILGDIQYYDFQSSTFDMIVCWDVLEHLEKPELALQNFFRVLNQNGIIIVVAPNVMSLKGLLTKFTPYWIHVFVKKNLLTKKDAGENDRGPFRTYLKFSMSPSSMRKFDSENGLSIEYFHTSDVLTKLHRKSRLAFVVYVSLRTIFTIISFGTMGDSEYTIVLKKNSRQRKW